MDECWNRNKTCGVFFNKIAIILNNAWNQSLIIDQSNSCIAIVFGDNSLTISAYRITENALAPIIAQSLCLTAAVAPVELEVIPAVGLVALGTVHTALVQIGVETECAAGALLFHAVDCYVELSGGVATGHVATGAGTAAVTFSDYGGSFETFWGVGALPPTVVLVVEG